MMRGNAMLSLGLLGPCLGNPVPSHIVQEGVQIRQFDYFPPHWSAIGDSYSAGPGAGDNYDKFEYGGKNCYRGKGAYAPQLDALNEDRLGTFQFLSCTGHVTDNVTQYQTPDLLWGGHGSEMFVTLSIGGNDLFFSDYVKACLIGLPGTDCDETIDKITNLIDNRDGRDTFKNSLFKVWESLSNLTRDRDRPGEFVPWIVHTLYPTFFNPSTDHCDNVRILKIGPKLTKDLREQTNDLVRRANSAIKRHADDFLTGEENRYKHWAWRGHLYLLDYNDGWDGHRLCEDFVTDGPGFSNPDVWILGVSGPDVEGDDVTASEAPDISQVDINTCNPDSADLGEAYGCEVARYMAEHPGEDVTDLLTLLPKWITKAFHPKTAGFKEVRDQIYDYWFPYRPNLRVLPLGDSITYGFQSTNGAGYRGLFYALATQPNQYKVDMIGSVKAGDMPDSDNEGHNGATISEISSFADRSLRQRPNVVLLHAGTNDMNDDASAAGAVDRLTDLIDKIITQCPDATVLVARIVASSDAATQNRINMFNDGVEAAVETRASSGRHVQLMIMDAVVTAEYLSDGIHPNDEGYDRMGSHWWSGLQQAYFNGWLEDPVAADEPDDETCPTVPTWIPQGTIASGGGLGRALTYERRCQAGDCSPGSQWPNQFVCASNCIGGACSEDKETGSYVCDSCAGTGSSCFCTYTNGDTDTVDNPTGGNCSVFDSAEFNAVKMADIDGDGRDDYLHVDKQGRVTMYWNTGRAPDEGSNAGKVVWMPMGVIATGVGARGDQVRFADLDGDGRAEYIWVKDSGAATVWWNLGFNPDAETKVAWHSATGEDIASGIGDGQGVAFADMNGDGMADFIHLAPNGAATLYINQGRSPSGGWGWWDWGVVATGVGSGREDIRFADFNGDGRDDYAVVDPDTGGLNVWYNRGTESGSWGSVAPIIWWNPGEPIASGVSYLPNWDKSLMVTFGDLNGDGRDEYFYVGGDDSSVYAFLNGC